MAPERWKEIIDNIQEKFEVIELGEEKLEEEGGAEIEYIEFTGPLGKMRLEYITRPLVLDKKTTYSRRIGSETQVDYVYSDSEKSHKLMVYKWDEDAGDFVHHGCLQRPQSRATRYPHPRGSAPCCHRDEAEVPETDEGDSARD